MNAGESRILEPAFGDQVAADHEEAIDRQFSEGDRTEDRGQYLVRPVSILDFVGVRNDDQTCEDEPQQIEVVVVVLDRVRCHGRAAFMWEGVRHGRSQSSAAGTARRRCILACDTKQVNDRGSNGPAWKYLALGRSTRHGSPATVFKSQSIAIAEVEGGWLSSQWRSGPASTAAAQKIRRPDGLLQSRRPRCDPRPVATESWDGDARIRPWPARLAGPGEAADSTVFRVPGMSWESVPFAIEAG